MLPICYFHDCTNPALLSGKCEKHRVRIKCSEPNCYNQTYARNLCVRHGGKKICYFPHCTANARSRGLCSKHGEPTTKRWCEEEGCTKIAHSRRRCIHHGGSRKCRVPECVAYSRHGGYCRRHVSDNISPKKETLESILPYMDESKDLTSNMFQFDIKLLDTAFFPNERLDYLFTDEDIVILDYFIQ